MEFKYSVSTVESDEIIMARKALLDFRREGKKNIYTFKELEYFRIK